MLKHYSEGGDDVVMTETIILTFSVFFIALIGTKGVIATLRKNPSPDIDVLMGRSMPLPVQEGGIAVAFALIIGLLGANASYAVVFPLFFLVAVALLGKLVNIRMGINLAVYVLSVFIGLKVFTLPIFFTFLPPEIDKIIAGIFWLAVMLSFSKFEKTESLFSIHMIAIGLGLAGISVLAEQFPSMLSTSGLIVAGVGVGFMWWNLSPAKVFAGKIGALPAGFIAGYLLLLAASAGYIATAIILPAYLLLYRPDKYRKERKLSVRDWNARLIAGVNMLLIYIAAQTFISPQMQWFDVAVAYSMVVLLEFFPGRKSQ